MPEINKNSDRTRMDKADLHTDNGVVDYVRTLWTIGKGRKQEREQRWARHLRHFDGDQWAHYDPSKGAIVHAYPNESDTHRVRLCLSLLPGYITQMIAKLSEGKLSWRADPMSDDQSDRDRSDHCNKTLKHLSERLHIQSKRVEAMMWLGICHDVFLQSTWDSDAGKPISLTPKDMDVEMGDNSDMWGDKVNTVLEHLEIGPENARAFDDDGNLETSEGDNSLEVVDPFQMIPDLDEVRWKDGQYCLRSRRRTEDYLMERYPDKKDEIGRLGEGDKDDPGRDDVYLRTDYASSMDAGKTSGFLSRWNWGRGRGGSGAESGPKTYLVHEFWHRPNSEHLNGIHAVVSGKTLLYKGDNPYGCLPFVHLQETPQPNDFWGTGAFTNADEIQVALNGVVSKTMEILANTAAPQLWIKKNCGLNVDTLMCEPGSVNETLDPKSDILQLPQQSPPAYVQWLVEMYVEQLQRVTGVHDVSMGKPSSKAQSGVSINLLQEANSARYGPIYDRHEDALAEVGKQQLSIVAKNWDDERNLWIAGETGERQWHTLSGTDLIGEDAGQGGLIDFDVRVSIERKRSRAAVMEEVRFMTELGYLNPQDAKHRELVLSMMHYVELIGGGFDAASGDRSKASQENQKLLAGEQLKVDYGDEDQDHIEVHKKFTVTEEFRREKEHSPVIDQTTGKTLAEALMDQHIVEHYRQAAQKVVAPQIMLKMAEIEAMQKARLIPPPGTGPPGEAPGPPGAGTPDTGGPGGASPGGAPGEIPLPSIQMGPTVGGQPIGQ